jgi:hypothetical protein
MPSNTMSLSEYVRLQLAIRDGDPDPEHLELESHRIEQIIPGVIQYNLLPKGDLPWLRGIGVNCSEEQIGKVRDGILGRWAEPRNSNLLLPESSSKTTTRVFFTSSVTTNPPAEDAKVGEWVYQPVSILERLENTSFSEKDRLAAVLFAETKPFDGELRPRLLVELDRFIHANRLTEDADRMIYLCSAIRKYAMNMGQDQIDAYVKWLLPSETSPVHHEVEMEFVKGLSYRLQFETLTLPQESPNALDILSEIAFAYLRKSLVLQKSYANTAMFVIVCISILESLSETHDGITEDLLCRVEALGITWFQEMVEDNLAEAVEFVEAKNPDVADKLRSLLGNK